MQRVCQHKGVKNHTVSLDRWRSVYRCQICRDVSTITPRWLAGGLPKRQGFHIFPLNTLENIIYIYIYIHDYNINIQLFIYIYINTHSDAINKSWDTPCFLEIAVGMFSVLGSGVACYRPGNFCDPFGTLWLGKPIMKEPMVPVDVPTNPTTLNRLGGW